MVAAADVHVGPNQFACVNRFHKPRSCPGVITLLKGFYIVGLAIQDRLAVVVEGLRHVLAGSCVSAPHNAAIDKPGGTKFGSIGQRDFDRRKTVVVGQKPCHQIHGLLAVAGVKRSIRDQQADDFICIFSCLEQSANFLENTLGGLCHHVLGNHKQ